MWDMWSVKLAPYQSTCLCYRLRVRSVPTKLHRGNIMYSRGKFIFLSFSAFFFFLFFFFFFFFFDEDKIRVHFLRYQPTNFFLKIQHHCMLEGGVGSFLGWRKKILFKIQNNSVADEVCIVHNFCEKENASLSAALMPTKMRVVDSPKVGSWFFNPFCKKKKNPYSSCLKIHTLRWGFCCHHIDLHHKLTFRGQPEHQWK